MSTTTTASPQVAINDVGTPEELLKAIDQTIKYFNDGDLVSGTVVKIDRDEVLLDIYKYSFTWNNYGLCFTFLNILIELHHNSTNKFIIIFMKLLVNNLHFQPDKRFLSETILSKFYAFLDNIDKSHYL